MSRHPHRRRIIEAGIGAILTAALAATPANAGTSVQGALTAGGGYLAHPLGIAEDEDAGYLHQSLRLILLRQGPSDAWRFIYEGTGYEFEAAAPLGQMRHAAGVEWFGAAGTGSWGLRAGAQAATRIHADAYGSYDFAEGAAYLAFKHYLAEGLLWRGSVNLRYRDYSELPEESYLETRLETRLQRFLASRTTLEFRLDAGGKAYTDPAASRTWETAGTPTTSQIRVGGRVARGFGDRTSAWVDAEARLSLAGFPHVVREDLYDSPLLDAYASQGARFEVAARRLLPWQLWIEGGGAYGFWDYGELEFSPLEGGATDRSDRITQAYLSLDRQFNVGASRRVKASVWLGWTDQRSDLPLYDLTGPSVSTSLAWSF
jgi:hypothetical protein